MHAVTLGLQAEASNVWGDVPTWITGVATVVALIFAAAAAVYARRMFRIEFDRDRIAAGERREHNAALTRSQSAQVSAWWGQLPRSGQWGIFVRNGSEAPVFQAHVTVLSDDGVDIAGSHITVIPPTSRPTFYPLAGNDPQEDRNVAIKVRRVRMTFTDAAGLRWMRNQSGRLRQFEPSLIVKTDPSRANALQHFADDFLEAYGVTLTFEEIHTAMCDQLAPLFVTQSREDGVADALIGAHDWLGELVCDGLVEPTVLAADHRGAFRPWTLSALTYNGHLYGVPTTLDAAVLVRNVNLAPVAPASMEELIATGSALRAKGRVLEPLAVRVTSDGDPFQLWPIFASAGGWLFERINGEWDPARIGLDNQGSIVAFERLRPWANQAPSCFVAPWTEQRPLSCSSMDRRRTS